MKQLMFASNRSW